MMILVLENEVSLDNRYLVDEITHYLPESKVYDYTKNGGSPPLDGISGVIIGGSTAGVYERDEYTWMEDQMDLIRELVEREIPTLGICFGHQIINKALGGEVEYTGRRRANLVKAEFSDDPLLRDVKPVVPVLHSDKVTETSDEMDVIGSSEYYEYFATRHRSSPLWTIQFHPEFTPRVKHLGYGWRDNHHSFNDSNATKAITNFYRITVNQQTSKVIQ